MILGLFARFFGGGEWDLDSIEPPWGSRPSIYEHIEAHIVEGEAGLSDGGDSLPDESEVFEEGGLRWVAGGLDGVLGHHGGGGEAQETASRVFELLRNALERPDNGGVAELYAALKTENSLGYADALLEKVVEQRGIDADRLHDLAVWLATKAADREPVKVAVALLGIFQGYDDREVLLTLARHDEFTLYAAVAVSNTEENPDRSLWEIAKNVDGWGRIETVERLAETTDPEIKAWMLREGYKNSIMYEYLAYTCATTGDLEGALSADEIDDELLHGAGEILQALFRGGPAADIDDYESGVVVTDAYLDHLSGRAEKLDQFLILKTIEEFLEEEVDWSERSKRGWTPDARKSILARVEVMVAEERWRDQALAGLETSESAEFWVASGAAEALGIDTWPHYFARTQAGENYWFQLMQSRDRSRIERVVELAAARLPLDEIATGPGGELGLGPEFKHHGDLDFVLQDLGAFPGLGWNLVQTGLMSPVVRNRHMALRVLSDWGKDAWPADAREVLERCHDAEPDEDVKIDLERLLAGRPLEE